MTDSIFSPAVWAVLTAFVLPLIAVVVGSLAYWVRKLDDRTFNLAVKSVTHEALQIALRPTNDRLDRIEHRLNGANVIRMNRDDHHG